MTMWANSARSDAEGYAAEAADLLAGGGASVEYDALRAKFEDADSTRSTAEVASWVLYAVGGGAAITGAVLLLTGDGGGGAQTAGMAVTPFALPVGGGISFSGGF